MDNNNIYESAPYSQNDFEDNTNKKGLAIASMVIAIISLILCCCFGFNLILSIPALILGIISLAKGRGGKGMAVAGVIISSIATLLGAYILITYIPYMGMFKDFATFFADYPESTEAYEETGELPDYLIEYTGEEYDYLWENAGYDDVYDFIDDLIEQLEEAE